MSKLIDLSGKKFGRLKVINIAYKKKYNYYWNCICDCGKQKIVMGSHLRSGRIKSCGCLSIEALKKRATTHGLTKTRIYKIWRGMIDRCYFSSHKFYKNYGGRGICMCDEWHYDFQSFYDWAYANGYEENAPRGKCTIDRIDNNGNYCPENCRFISNKEQLNNTTVVKKFLYNNKIMTLNELSKISGLSKMCIYKRLARGWTLEKALKEKIKH